MSTLYLLSHAPHSDPLSVSTLDLARSGDAVLLLEDGVYAAGAAPTPLSPALAAAQERGVAVYALQPDAAARGVTSVVPTVDYEGFVELIVQHERSVH